MHHPVELTHTDVPSKSELAHGSTSIYSLGMSTEEVSRTPSPRIHYIDPAGDGQAIGRTIRSLAGLPQTTVQSRLYSEAGRLLSSYAFSGGEFEAGRNCHSSSAEKMA